MFPMSFSAAVDTAGFSAPDGAVRFHDPIHTQHADDAWWRSSVIYQVYPRSFRDANGDGMGDLAGVREELEHLVRLNVDAVWLSPFYTSPQRDGGYDVADYCDVDPLFGTLADFDALTTRATELGIKVIVDLVPNHASSDHILFKQALAAPAGSPERTGRAWGAPAQQLAVPLRWSGLDPRHQQRRGGRAVVPPPLRFLPARLQLGQPGGAGRVRAHPALLA